MTQDSAPKIKILLRNYLKALHSVPQDPAPSLGFHLSKSSPPTRLQSKVQDGGLEVEGRSHSLYYY